MDDREPCCIYVAFALYPLRGAFQVNKWRHDACHCRQCLRLREGHRAVDLCSLRQLALIVRKVTEYVIRTGRFASTSLEGP